MKKEKKNEIRNQIDLIKQRKEGRQNKNMKKGKSYKKVEEKKEDW